MIFSGLCHDVNHRGRTNIFEKNTESGIALIYNDQSVNIYKEYQDIGKPP